MSFVLLCVIFTFAGITALTQKSMALDTELNQLKDMFSIDESKYICQICNTKYKTIGGIKRHLKNEHMWHFTVDESGKPSELDHIALYRASLMKCALLLRDTNDAYKMGDGDRVTVNAKFQMLLSRVGNHTKYQLWLFRYLANCLTLLTPRMAYEYKWNCSANMCGGIGHNIPNDNLVELLVQAVKKKVYAQGANVSYDSVKKAALTLQIQDEIKDNMQEECGREQTGTRRPVVHKKNDIIAIVSQLNAAQVFAYIPGREYKFFCFY